MNEVEELEYKGSKVIKAESALKWREWLHLNHEREDSIWLIIFKKSSNIRSVYYSEAVDEALCFGWIDSKPNKRDSQSYYQYFSKRNPKSNWSKVNKEKIKQLVKLDKLEAKGIEMVEIAKSNGTWEALNDVDNLIVPTDLSKEFDINEDAKVSWNQFPRSVRRGILEWIFNAKKPETRKKRIDKTIRLAKIGKRALYDE